MAFFITQLCTITLHNCVLLFCNIHFNATSYLFENNHTISVDLKREIVLRLCRIQSIKDIAHDLFISEASVQRVLMDLADQYKPDLNSLPRTLCIDEFKSMRSVKGKMSFIAVDGNKQCLFELLEDRRLRSLLEHYQQFSLKARRNVKYLVMDMNASYDQLVKSVFPNARVIYDHFHIAKHLNDTMNHVRIHVYNRLRKGDKEAQKKARRIIGDYFYKTRIIYVNVIIMRDDIFIILLIQSSF